MGFSEQKGIGEKEIPKKKFFFAIAKNPFAFPAISTR